MMMPRSIPTSLRDLLESAALLVALSLCLAGTAQAQDYLPREEVVALLRENAICYEPNTFGDCTYAEVFHQPDGPEVTSRLALMAGPGQMLILEQMSTLVGDALCIRDGDLGILRTYVLQDTAFFFDFRGQVQQSPERTAEVIAAFAEGAQSKTCFRFVRDPSDPDALVQHIFADSVRQTGESRVHLVPLSENVVRLLVQ